MKVLFINIPAGLETGKNLAPNFTKPPVAHLWLAAILEQHGVETDIYDAFALGASVSAILDQVEEKKPDMIGFTVFTYAVPDVIYICHEIKKRFPHIYIIAGGYHTSLAVDDLINVPDIDFACIGEGEFTMIELIRSLETGESLSHIQGLVYKEHGRVIRNVERPLRTDMDNVPVLAYNKIIDNNYASWWSIDRSGRQRFISTVTGKGCPMNCIWCAIAKTEGLKYRCMSAERVLLELKYLKNELGVTHLSFDDANFTVYGRRVLEICRGIDENGIDIKWSCASTIIHGDDDNLLRAMKRAGCESIFYGVESGNDEILARVKKITKQRVRSVMKKTWRAGIRPHCSFILGLPGDTKETMNETVKFAIELSPASVSFSIAIPYKGTALYEEYESKGYIKTRDWSKYENNAVFETAEFSQDYLERLLITAHRRFYWRPKFIIGKLLQIRSLKEFAMNASIALNMLRKRIRYKS